MNDEARSLHIHLTSQGAISFHCAADSQPDISYSNRGDQRGAVMVRISAVVTLTTPGRIGWDGTYSNFPDLAPVVLQCGWGFSSAARGRFRRFPFDSTHSADRKDQRGAVSMLSLYSASFLPAFSGG